MSDSVLQNGCRPIALFGWQKILQKMRMLFFTERMFCECCGMQLRSSPAGRVYREEFRAKKNELMENVLVRR
jgi:hypothetical protein